MNFPLGMRGDIFGMKLLQFVFQFAREISDYVHEVNEGRGIAREQGCTQQTVVATTIPNMVVGSGHHGFNVL
jgi:hypothetical protein